MRAGDRFEGLLVFLAVARVRSFRGAAKNLGVTAGAVSQSIRALEARLGLPLFQRSTRHVGLTEAGASLYARLGPPTAEIGDALEALDGMRARPTGLLRLTVPRMVVPLFIEPILERLHLEHPDISVELSADDSFVDLAEKGFDAGVRLGDAVGRDMVGVRMTGDLRWHVAGSPSYLAAHGSPQSPEDLLSHSCIRYRFPRGGAIYRWEFTKDGREIAIDVPGRFTVDDGQLQISLARQGFGLTYGSHVSLERDLAAGTLVSVLDAGKSPGFYLYFLRGAGKQPKLRAFIDAMHATLGTASRPRGPAAPSRPTGSRRR